MKKILILSLIAWTGWLLSAADVVLVQNHQPQAVIVIAERANPVAEYAASELATYLKKSTGATFKILTEKQADTTTTRIYVGNTQAAEKVGLGVQKFPQEKFIIQVVKGNVYITGGENAQALIEPQTLTSGRRTSRQKGALGWSGGIVRDTRRGTLYGVYRFLDHFLGIKWLWPGELGTYIPQQAELKIADNFSLKGAPAVDSRHYRIWQVGLQYYRGDHRTPELDQLRFTTEGNRCYVQALQKYLLVHQEGESAPLPAVPQHVYTWWREFGRTQHPEFFAMRDDGKRLPPPDYYQPRLCVSNPGLHQFIVNKKWDGSDWLGLGEADCRSFCRCPKCMEWDKPQPAYLEGYSTTNRYLRYAQEVRKLALKRNPQVKISILMYMDYLFPPDKKMDLSWMYGKFVPWGSGVSCYYPMSKHDHQFIMKMWKMWANTGIGMGYRPNYLLSGYVIPALDIEQSGEMLRFALQHNMKTFDYDSLFGYWATKGPMLYMHMRLGTNPKLTLEQIMDEYYSAFGPAKTLVKKYFDYWIAYTKKLPHGGVTFGNAAEAAEHYPMKVFVPAEQILQQALMKAQTASRPDYAQRVQFLVDGLTHAKIATQFSHEIVNNRFAAAQKTLKTLIAFRRAHESDFICDYNAAQQAEISGYKNLQGFMQGKFKHVFNPNFRQRNFKWSLTHKFVNLKAGKWALNLPKGKNFGYVVYKFDAGADNCFLTGQLKIFARNKDVKNELAISHDGKNYTAIAQNIDRQKVDLSSRIKNKSQFFLRFSLQRNTAKVESLMGLIEFRLDYTKKFPEKVKIRQKLDIGTGWLDFKSNWYFLKDPHHRGIAPKIMLPGNFPPAGWTAVKVPARLATTAVGPYLGYGWYCTEFTVPQSWVGRSIDFLFGAVDEQAWVYLNGKLIGEHTVKSEKIGVGELWDESFIIHAKAGDLKLGQKNILVVKTHASAGQHGIWKPVKIRPVDASALY